MSEPTLRDIVSLIQSLERKMDQRFDQLEQAIKELKDDVHELKDDVKVNQEDIAYLRDRSEEQNKQIWKNQRLYTSLYKELKALDETKQKKSGL